MGIFIGRCGRNLRVFLYLLVATGNCEVLPTTGNVNNSSRIDEITLPENSDFTNVLFDNSERAPIPGIELETSGVIGSPQAVKDSLGLPHSLLFPSAPASGIILTAKQESRGLPLECPWELSACISGQFTLRFSISLEKEEKPAESKDDLYRTHVLTLATRTTSAGRGQGRWALVFTLEKGAILKAHWGPIVSAGNGHRIDKAMELQKSGRSLIEATVTLGDNGGDVGLVLMNSAEGLSGKPIKTQSGKHQSQSTGLNQLTNLAVLPEGQIGILIGNMVGEKPYPHGISFAIGEFRIETPDTERPRFPRRTVLSNVLGNIPMNPIKSVSAITFPENSYVRYEFKNRLKKTVDSEELIIDFTLPTGVSDGLIWYAENHASKSYVYIKGSRLYYTYVVIDETGRAKLTLTEEIFLNTTLVPDIPHELKLLRNRDKLTLTLDERSHASKSIDGRVPIVPADGQVYLGGSSKPRFDTDGKVDTTFQGRITKAKISRTGDKEFDFLQAATDLAWRDSVSYAGNLKYDYLYPKAELVIGPTSSNRGLGTKRALALSTTPTPITFMGFPSSVVRFDIWDFSVYGSFEISFQTYEPNGILFFVGPERDHTDFVCVELFDGNVYFVYGVGDHYRHIQLNPKNFKVNLGTTHRVYVSRNEQHRFLVKFNDMIVDVDQGGEAHQTEFSTYTYIGSVDQPSRLPWYVWSRENFAGCIHSIQVNRDKFLDPQSRMSQHTDVKRGLIFGECKVPDDRCSRTICGGGQCAQRSYPFFEPLNFACDCSRADKTFQDGVEDIRRSQTCFRDAPILRMDGEMSLLIDFERLQNTLTTHTDDISLQFKTQQSNIPLFYAVAPTEKSYFKVELVGGRISVKTNINHPDITQRHEEIYLNSAVLNDDRWHTLYIRRRADHIEITVDGYTQVGNIPLQSQLKTFKLVAQQIYLGSDGPRDFSRPPPPTSEVEFLPPEPRFVGEFRNFYWNEYDFIGTEELPSKYTTDLLTPRAVLPVFPQWPRHPTYSITATAQLKFARFNRIIDIRAGGDMWLIEFKTHYEGVILGAKDDESPDRLSVFLLILRGRLHVVFSTSGPSGVHQLSCGISPLGINDGEWHRVVLGLDKRRQRMTVFLDTCTPENIGSGVPLSSVRHLKFHFGGLPDADWQAVLALLRVYAATSLRDSEAEGGRQPVLTGCLGGFSLRSDNFANDLLMRHDSDLVAYPSEGLVRGVCREQVRCRADYCQNGGRCEEISDREIRCICTGTGYEGPRCSLEIRQCPLGYCHNGGVCSMVNGRPTCNCLASGYHGERCELNQCTSGDFCRNGGRCFMTDSVARCDCRQTGYTGSRCEEPVCPPGFCFNGGRCHIDVDGRPICDCSNTGYSGARCDQTICTPDFCSNGGQCQVNRFGQPECTCQGTGYTGPHCRIPICTRDFCSNGGQCVVDASNQPSCNCRGTMYTGDRCHLPICPIGYCSNGGICSVGGSDQPSCDCRGTGFTGDRCRLALCTDEHCLNRGRCYIGTGGQPTCSCTGTGFTGARCDTPICSSDYCLNGGRCQVDHTDQPNCDCDGTGFHGGRCQLPVCTPRHCLHLGTCRVGPGNQPVCDCTNTDYEGRICEISICPPGYCGGRGRCVVRNRQPFCECHGEYKGIRCETDICPENYCINGGVCSIESGGRPRCTCPLNYEGDRCELPKVCPENFCFHGGRCAMLGGTPRCDCDGTDYIGARCEIPQVCPVGFCQHGGNCSVQSGRFVCDCSKTGYRGVICNEPIACPTDYCLHNGICTVLPNNQYSCDCSRTGRSGKNCESSSYGIYVTYTADGYLVYPIIPSVRTIEDNVTLGYKTYMQSGTLITFLSPDGRHWGLNLRNGRLWINANGEQLYSFQRTTNDGQYHLVNVERKGDKMMVTQDTEVLGVPIPKLVNPLDKSLIYNAIHIAADQREQDIFRGVIGGVHWNGRYPIQELNDKVYKARGTVVIVLTPEFPIEQPHCKDYCRNNGRCYLDNNRQKCECPKEWMGPRCDLRSRGYHWFDWSRSIYSIFSVMPPEKTNVDEMSVAFQTWRRDGPIATVMRTDSKFFDIKLINGKLFASFNGIHVVQISRDGQVLNDGNVHTIGVSRNGALFNFSVDGYATEHKIPAFVATDGTLIVQQIILGTDRTFTEYFNGLLGGFSWNGKYLIDEYGLIASNVQIMTLPNRQPVTGKNNEVIVVLMPHLIPKGGKPVTPGPVPDTLPPGHSMGGIVMPGVGTKDAGLGAPIYIPEGLKISGVGQAGMNAGQGLLVNTAGGLLGLGGVVDALLAGLLLALLLLISALIWACWRCKPGCCAFCFGKGGKRSGGQSAWSRLSKWCCGAPAGGVSSKERKNLLDDMDTGKELMDGKTQIGFHSEPMSPPIYLEQPFVGDGINAYNMDGMKVDSVLITKNSKSFVIGSGTGPPKVLDAHTGELHRTMEGHELGCTDLNLACEDTILVTQVIDDLGPGIDTMSDMNSIKVKRVQLWDFATGVQRGMGVDLMCTATCLARNSSHIVISRVTPGLPSIMVWSLATNQMEHEIPYHPWVPAVKESVTFLKLSFDDRLVVAGFAHPMDQQACYMVFDLAAHHDGPFEPRVLTFDGKVEATEITSNDTAITGTHKGELLVWNLHTLTIIRQIQINATIEGGNPTMLPPHTGTVHCVRLSADSRFLVTGSQDQLARVWVMPEERLLHTLEGHSDDVLSVAISTDSELIVTGSWDGSIRIWRLKNGKQICWFTSNVEILQVKISEDKQSIVALGERTGFRKLITLHVVRDLVRITTKLNKSPGIMHPPSPMSPSTPGFAPSSPVLMA